MLDLLYTKAEGFHGVGIEYRAALLRHDRPRIVFGANKLYRRTRHLAATFEHGLMHAVAVHRCPAERRKQCRMNIENAIFVTHYYFLWQTLHVTREQDRICVRGLQCLEQ